MESIYIKSLDTVVERVITEDDRCSCGGSIWSIDGKKVCGWCRTEF